MTLIAGKPKKINPKNLMIKRTKSPSVEKEHIHKIMEDSKGRVMNDDGYYVCECGATTFPNCPWFVPTPTHPKTKSWEKEFEKKFLVRDGVGLYGVIKADEVFDFISQVRTQAIEETVEEIRKLLESCPTDSYGATVVIDIDDLLTHLNKK